MKDILYKLLVFTILITGCQNQPSHLPGIVTVDYSPTELAPADATFKRLPSEQTGIVFNNLIRDLEKFNINTYDYFYNGGGVAIGDINNDDLPDIFFTGNMVPNRLYLNKGNFVFEDITNESGLYSDQYWSTGVSMIDINQDGWKDIYVCNSGPIGFVPSRQNLLYINNKDGTFKESAIEYGLEDGSFSSQATMLDYDLDGDLDLYLMNHTDFINRFKDERHFAKKLQAINKFANQEGAQKVFNNVLFERQSDGTFKRNEANILSQHWGYGLGLVASDINNDSYPDLYIANDYFLPDFFYINDGQGSFRQENKLRLGHNSQFSMGVDIADINNDGWADIGIVDMVSAERVRNKVLMAPMNEDNFRYVTERVGYQEQYMFNALQLNNGNGTFSEIGHLLGTTQTDWSWTSLFADFDLDGDKDYLITNGFRRDTKHRDIQAEIIEETKKINPKTDSVSTIDYLARYPSVPLTNYIFENTGEFQFKDESTKWGFVDPSFSNGAAYGDLDNDGDLDLVINNIDREAFVYQNTTIEKNNSNYIKFSFDSDPKNYNAKITITTESRNQFIEYNPTRGYLSSMDPKLVVGLGQEKSIKQIRIEFLYGKELILNDVPANQTLEISINSPEVKKFKAKIPPKLLFENSSDIVVDFRHRENEFWDFTKEVLLPHKESTNGPHISVGDVNGDRLEDFFVGGARNNEAGLFIQTRSGKFQKSIQEAIVADSIYEDMGSVFFDADMDGDQDLYVVSGGGGDVTLDHLLKDRLYLNDGKGNFSKSNSSLPEMTGSGMRVKTCDYDQDGDLDLFIGGRIVPGQYPAPAESFLLENQNGIFSNVIAQNAPELKSMGMITDFEWVDFSGDGQVDLVLVGEWMRIEFFEQKSGRFENVTDQYIPKDTRGWWFSIASGDFDADGDIDFIAGNLGLNNKFHASEKKPLEIYFNDFDDNGTNDIVLAKTDDKGQNYAMRGKDCSTAQMPFISEKYKKYEDFATASLADVYTDEKLKTSIHYSVSDFSSIFLENTGGQFVIKQLPRRAQFAPIQDILVGDFDNDGLIDAVVGGNIYDTEIETTSYDAGTGVFLKGDGHGNFKAHAVHESGLYLGRNLKDMALIKILGRKHILGANNNDVLDFIKVNK